MENVRVPFTLTVQMPFNPHGRDSRDGFMRHPSNGWTHRGAPSPPLLRTEHRPASQNAGDRTVTTPVPVELPDGTTIPNGSTPGGVSLSPLWDLSVASAGGVFILSEHSTP
jgi:hypothetical protein